MLDYKLIRKLIKGKGLTYNFVFDRIGYTKQGYKSAEERDTLTAKAASIIANILQVPIGTLFGEGDQDKIYQYINASGTDSRVGEINNVYGGPGDGQELLRLKDENKALKKEIKLKDQSLEDKERTIMILMKE